MDGKSLKKNDWMTTLQIAAICVSVTISATLWYFSQQNTMVEKIESKYVSKVELELISQKLNSAETSLKELKSDFTDKLKMLEETNNEIVELITDIRLTLARRSGQ